ncbi:MAG: hypothetical protein E6Q97_35225 [Desulfurellales bacterium]|nr:MAG: hypothetical protein E6Q97_35225 [Desulfurellales bacterium]
MKRLLLAIALLLGLADVAAAQNVTCATRPVTDNSNACANTAFVNSYVNNPSSPIYSTAHTWLATQTFSASNPSGICPLSSFYAPGIDPGNKGIACAQAVWNSGNGGLNGSAIVANTVVESTAGGVGAPGAIIAGTLVKADIANLDPYGILGLINNDTAVTAPLGTALWGIVRGAKATGGSVDGLRVASEVANGQRPRFGVAVYNTETDNAFDYGVIAASANLYGVVVGNPGGTNPNDKFPTFPMAVYAKSLGTTWHDGLLLHNATAATAGAQQMSPSIRWGGNGWKTNATAGSQFVDFRADLLPVQGTTAPSSYLRFASSVNNGAYTPNVYFTSGNGVGVGAIPNVAANNGDLTVYRGANSGAIQFGDGGARYILQDGSNWTFAGGAALGFTSVVTPLIVGGSGTGTQLVLKTTSGIGTTDSLAIVGGNNGTTNFATFTASGLTIPATIVAGQFAPSGAGAPANGMYLPAANTIGFTTNSTERLRIDSNGDITATSDTFLLTSKSTGASAHSLPQIAMRSNENPGASGVGGHLRYQVYSSTGVLRDAVQLNGGLIDVTNGAENGDLDILVYRAGTVDVALAVRGDWASIAPGSSNTWSLGRSANTWKDGFFSGTIYANTHTADGTAARTWSMSRNTTAATAGQNLTIQAGGAVSGGTDLTGGNLILASGIATGSGGAVFSNGAIIFAGASSGGSSGTGDINPTEIMRISNAAGGYGILTFSGTDGNAYAITGASADPITYFNGKDGMNVRVSNTDRVRFRTSLALFGIPVGDPILSAGATVHIGTGAAAAPVVTACGTLPSIVGTDTAGEVTMGTGSPTGCTITFNLAYTSAPFCTVTWQGNPLATQNYTVSTSAITLTQTATSSNKVNYTCIARSGG